MRAWTLIRTMNATFRSPLVEKERGGPAKGGAHLTPRGRKMLEGMGADYEQELEELKASVIE